MMSVAQQKRTVTSTPKLSSKDVDKRRVLLLSGNRHRSDPQQLPSGLHAKLKIGKSNDPFEQQADRVANQVMNLPSMSPISAVEHNAESFVQRKCSCTETHQSGGTCEKCRKNQLRLKRMEGRSAKTNHVPSSVHETLRSAGQPLDSATRRFMETRFGYDFRDVRIHTDSTASQSAESINALAYTVGNHIAFASGEYATGTSRGNRLLAHELAHVVQQTGSQDHVISQSSVLRQLDGRRVVSDLIQRAGNPAALPPNFACPFDLTTGTPSGTDLLFGTRRTTITAAHNVQLATFVTAWVAAGASDDIVVHGYASTVGPDEMNWSLSCERARNVRAALIARGIPAIHISIVAHGESTDFGAAAAANQHAVITTSAAGIFSTPLVIPRLTPGDNFAGRSISRFGVGEVIRLDFVSLPPRPAADFGGLRWTVVSGGGRLTRVTLAGTATYRAPARADTVQLDLRVASGVTRGRVVASRTISIVEPNDVHMVVVPGTAPSFGRGGAAIPPGTWGVGFLANVFVDPKDVSFQGVVFGEGVATSVVTPPGSFLSPAAGLRHRRNTFGPAHGGNATTGTAVSPPPDHSLITSRPTGTFQGQPTCGESDFVFPIPWEFSVAGGARKAFAIGTSHKRSTLFCNAIGEKAGAGPFCRRIDGTTC